MLIALNKQVHTQNNGKQKKNLIHKNVMKLILITKYDRNYFIQPILPGVDRK